jgi:hypothetical protein
MRHFWRNALSVDMSFFEYRLCGLRIAADFPIPELLPWEGPAEWPVDVHIRRGAVPAQLDGADHVGPVYQTRGADHYLLNIPGSARFLVREGREIVVDRPDEVDETDTRAVLNGPVQAVLCHQRGLYPLHASTVIADGRAIAIAGPSGVGKSTLAARLAAKGLAVIADDICVVETARPGPPVVLPAYPRLRLWADAVEALGVDRANLVQALHGKPKYLMDALCAFSDAPVELSAVILLRRESGRKDFQLRRHKGQAAVQAVASMVQLRRVAGHLGLAPRQVADAVRVAAAAAVWELTCPDDIGRLDEAVAHVRDMAGMPR